MPSLKDTKRRIGSVKNTQKITRAMKLVSSAKYARANRSLMGARPYGEALDRIVGHFLETRGTERSQHEGDIGNAPVREALDELLFERTEKRSLFIVLATDRGLCGGLNSNLLKFCDAFLSEKQKKGISCDFMLWGRRAIQFGQKRKQFQMVSNRERVLEKPSYEFAMEAAEKFSKEFVDGKYDRVYIAYSRFKNALTQSPSVEQVLPIRWSSSGGSEEKKSREGAALGANNFLFEPSLGILLSEVLKKQLAANIFGYLLQGSASEHAARMTAMDNATNNADGVIRRLTLAYNRARQAAITKELIEITSGAEAL